VKLTKKELQLLLNALIVWKDDATFEGEVSLDKAEQEQFKKLHTKLFTAYESYVLKHESNITSKTVDN
jgi:hypothetical protein